MPKPGYKTTELYVSLAAAVLVAIDAVPTPHDARGYLVVAIAGLYALSRGLAKINAGTDPLTPDTTDQAQTDHGATPTPTPFTPPPQAS
jgi:hypothetical protein